MALETVLSPLRSPAFCTVALTVYSMLAWLLLMEEGISRGRYSTKGTWMPSLPAGTVVATVRIYREINGILLPKLMNGKDEGLNGVIMPTPLVRPYYSARQIQCSVLHPKLSVST